MLANLTKTTHWQFIFLTPTSETRITAASSRLCSSTTSNVSDLSGSKKKKGGETPLSVGFSSGWRGRDFSRLKVPISAEPADVNIVRAAGLSGGNISCYRTCCKMLSNWTETKTQKNEQDKHLLNHLKQVGWGQQGHQRSRGVLFSLANDWLQ